MARKIIEGANALEATLSGVRDSVRKRIMRNSVNRALTIVAREVRSSSMARDSFSRSHHLCSSLSSPVLPM